jgi:hypothetical protein
VKVYDICASLFVSFAVGMFLTAIISMILRPVVPDDLSLPILGAVFLIIWALFPAVLAGAGWEHKMNRLVMLILCVISYLFLSAGLIGLNLGDVISVGIPIPLVWGIFTLGRSKAESVWIQRLLIIRRNRHEFTSELPEEEKETWEN